MRLALGAFLAMSVALVAPQVAGAADPIGTMYVSDYASSTIDVFAPGSTGDIAPIRAISGPDTGLAGPADVKIDATGDIYASNFNDSTITVYAPGATGDAMPIRTIAGSNTGLSSNDDITLASDGTLFVGNAGGGVDVFAPGANGNVVPVRVIEGASTGLAGVDGIGIDTSGAIYADSQGGVDVFAPGASGDVTPIRTITGLATGLSFPDDVVVASSGEAYVSDGANSVEVFPAGANGDVAPVRSISGPDTGLSNLDDLAVDSSGTVYVTNFSGSVTVYPPGSTGDTAPSATISGPTTTLVQPEGVAVVEGSQVGGCPATTPTATLDVNVLAQICQFGADQSTIANGEEGLLRVASLLPHVSQLGTLWVAPEGGTLTVLNGSDARASLNLMRDAANDALGIVAEMAVERAASALGGCGSAAGAALAGAASSANDALNAAGKSAQAFGNVTSGSATTGTDTATAAGYAALAAGDTISALHSLSNALNELEQCVANNATVSVTVVVQIKVVIIEINDVDTQLQAAEQADIGYVPLGGYDLIPGEPNNNFTSGATAIIDGGGLEWTGNTLAPSLNSIGLPPNTVIHEETGLSGLAVVDQGSIGSVGQGSLLSLSGGGFQGSVAFGISSTPVRLTVTSANALDTASATVRIPSDILPGHHELYAIGTAPGGTLRVLGSGITVTAPSSPLLTGARESNRRWREGRKLATAARNRRSQGAPLGTTFSFTLNEPASVTLTFTQPGPGRKFRGKCVTPSPKLRHARSCRLSITRGSLPVSGHTGVNTLSFQGRLTHTRSLALGGYAVQITAANNVGRTRPASLTFTIIR